MGQAPNHLSPLLSLWGAPTFNKEKLKILDICLFTSNLEDSVTVTRTQLLSHFNILPTLQLPSADTQSEPYYDHWSRTISFCPVLLVTGRRLILSWNTIFSWRVFLGGFWGALFLSLPVRTNFYPARDCKDDETKRNTVHPILDSARSLFTKQTNNLSSQPY
jgi:hypothetical protein